MASNQIHKARLCLMAVAAILTVGMASARASQVTGTLGSGTIGGTVDTGGSGSTLTGTVSGSNGSYSGGYSSIGSGVAVASASCPLLPVKLMERGWANDPADVTKLQTFLKDVEHYDVDVNGIFDDKTEAAVMSFQEAHVQSVMGPWNSSMPSGKVYITTIGEINSIACGQPQPLSEQELSMIATYTAQLNEQHQASLASVVSSTSTSTVVLPVSTATSADQTGETAAVSQSSYGILASIPSFIKYLFGF